MGKGSGGASSASEATQAFAGLSEVLGRLEGVRRSGEGYAAFCPAHDDTKRPSLTVSETEDKRILAFCHKGCTFREILDALDLTVSFPFPKPSREGNKRHYRVRDRAGRILAVHHREDTSGEAGSKKRVWWSTPDGKGGLGGLKSDALPLWGAEAVGSVPLDEPVVVCEGEKAASALTYRGIAAIGTVTGAAGTPASESLAVLSGRPVVLWPDSDEDGVAHMRRVGKLLSRLREPPTEIRWYEWEEATDKGDAADHPAVLRGGASLSALGAQLRSAPMFVPPYDPAVDGASTFTYVLAEYEFLRALRRKEGGLTGIRTPLAKMDDQLHGLNKGYSYIIASRPNVGKSLLSGQIALGVAMQGHRVLLQSPEMSAVQYLDRFACYVAGVNYFRVQEGRFSDSEERKLSGAARVVGSLPLLIDDYGGQTVVRVRENIERHEPELVIVDYLQYLLPDDVRANRTQQVGQISRDLARIKSDFGIPVVLAAQLNRASEHRQNSEPLLVDLRDSGEIEQDADVILMLHRPDLHNLEVEAWDEEVVLFCRKNRMGQLWHTKLWFVEGQQWLSDQRNPA